MGFRKNNTLCTHKIHSLFTNEDNTLIITEIKGLKSHGNFKIDLSSANKIYIMLHALMLHFISIQKTYHKNIEI